MDRDSFLALLESQQLLLGKWGIYVSERLSSALSENGHPPNLVKIDPKPRVKTIDSAAGKLSRKQYTNPLTQMTDLVGVRFVVLLTEDIETISSLIESDISWQATVSRDFLEERHKNAKVFDYQSKHYEIRPTPATMSSLGLEHEFCCEVQIRTLLQHAYAEMVHDNIYKPTGSVPSAAERHVARSMALIETTDEIFSKTMTLLVSGQEPRENLKSALKRIYTEAIGEPPRSLDQKISNLILDTFSELICEKTENEITALLEAKKFIPYKIKSRLDQSLLFTNSIILFVYYLVATIPASIVRDRWPLPGDWRSLSVVEADLNI